MADSRRVRIIIDADVVNALRGLQDVEQGLGRVGRQGSETTEVTSSFGQKLAAGLATVGVATGFDAIKAGFSKVLESGLSYEANMNTLQAVTNGNADQMRQFGDTAKALGNDVKLPGASAQTTAAAMLELAKGGLEVDEVLTAARGTMQLAAAAQIDGAQAAEIQTNALNAFGLGADKANHVADILANTANKSSGDITDFGQALAQSGGVANMFGVSIEDTSTVLGIFANAGLKGSDAGTSLKSALLAMLDPTNKQKDAIETLGLKIFDAQGNFVGMRSVTGDLGRAQKSLTEETFNTAAAQIFGTDAVRAAAFAAKAGTDGFDEMAAAVTKEGGAAEVAAANSHGLNGSIDNLNNTIDNVSLALYENFAPALEGIVGFATNAVSAFGDLAGKFSELPGPVQAVSIALGGVILLRGPLGSLWTSMGTSLIGMRTGFRTFAASVREASGATATFGVVAKGAMGVLGGPIGLAIIGVTTALSFMSSGTEDAAVATTDFSSAIDENTGKLKDNAAAIISKAAADGGSFDAYEAINGSVRDYTAALMGNSDAQNAVHTAILDAAEAGVRQSDVWKQVGASLEKQGTTARDVASQQLALGDSGKYVSDGMTAALSASQKFASDTGSLATSARQAQQALDGQKVATDGAAASTDSAAGSMTDLTGVTGDAEASTTRFADAVKASKDATSQADTAAQFLTIALLRLAGSDISAEQASRANEAAMRDIAAAARNAADAHDAVTDAQAKLDDMTAHLGGTLNGEEASASNLVITQQDLDAQTRKVADAKNREADASDNQKNAQEKAAQSARDMAAAAYNNTIKTQDMDAAIRAATRVLQVQRDKFIASQSAADQHSGAAARLADKLGLIPGNVKTAYGTPGLGAAISDTAGFVRNLLSFNGKTYTANVNAKFATELGSSISGAVDSVKNALSFNAEGGVMPGYAPGVDSIPAVLSPGEGILRPEVVRNIGPGWVYAANRAGKAGQSIPHFAEGGVVRPNSQSGYTNHGGNWQSGITANADAVINGSSAGAAAMTKGINDGLTSSIQAFFTAISNALMPKVSGFNPSQDPSSFGWVRAANQQPFSWGGMGTSVAGGTQPLWTSLLDALNPAIIGGVTSIGGFEDRNNVNNPSVPSFHAYGLAMDVNAPENPNGVSAASIQGRHGAIPVGLAQSTAARLGMEWGGDFGGTPDPMHFEIHVSPGGIGVGGTGASDFGGPASVGSGVERWRGRVTQALTMLGQPLSLVDTVLHQMDTESSGNPRAINLTDSNATVRGTPSKGLLQVIDPTFQAYRLPSLSSDIYDPLANIVAAIRYTIAAYGSVSAGMQGHAYAEGGIVPGGSTPGRDTVWAKASPGEAFLTNNQWATAKTAVMQAGGKNNAPVNVVVNNYIDGKQLDARTEYIVDGALVDLGAAIRRGMLQTT